MFQVTDCSQLLFAYSSFYTFLNLDIIILTINNKNESILVLQQYTTGQGMTGVNGWPAKINGWMLRGGQSQTTTKAQPTKPGHPTPAFPITE